jgi:diguanylate cyclase (GGDEF)-like protein
MESVEFLQGLPGWVNLLIAAGLVVAGIVITLVLRGSKRAPVRAAEESLPGMDREVQKTIARLESDNAALSHLFQLIPGFTKKMNSRIERREIPMEAMRVLEQLFAPSQILVFLLEERVERLSLVKHMGLPPDFSLSFQVGFGEGRIGWVAQHNVPMDVDDFIREKRLTGANMDMPGHFQFKVELCAPMSHEDQVRGVISVGGITRHYKHEKAILSLVADLASIALYNHDLFARTQEMANCDGLTKLYNKRFFMEKLSNVLVDAGRGHHPFSVFLFDLDNFKHYNDTQGHQAGDEVLKVTGELLRDSLRPDDIAARFGGEEFIVLLAHAPADGAMQAADRIRVRVAGHAFANRESQPLKIVSLSGGVATYPDDGLTSSDLIASADAALYRAKREGRNRIFASKPKYFSDEADDAINKAQAG